jgi:hypothetical protein
LNELWSDRLIEILIANPSKLHFRQEVLHGNLQRLDYDLDDIHTLRRCLFELQLFKKLLQAFVAGKLTVVKAEAV